MIEIVRKIMIDRRYRLRRFYVYTKKEADAKQVPYIYWKDAYAGYTGWVLSDDDLVGETIEIKQYKNNAFARFSFGACWLKRTPEFLAQERIKSGQFNTAKPEPWLDKLIRRKRFKKIAKLFAKMYLVGDIDWALLGKIHFPTLDPPMASLRVKRLLRHKQTRDIVMAEVDAILEQSGLSKKYIAETTKKMLELALEMEKLKEGIQLLELAGRWHHMEGDKIKETATFEQSAIVNTLTKAVEEEKKRIELTREKTDDVRTRKEDDSDDRVICEGA